jgi:hypothetical protein
MQRKTVIPRSGDRLSCLKCVKGKYRGSILHFSPFQYLVISREIVARLDGLKVFSLLRPPHSSYLWVSRGFTLSVR